jgi:hypothetical protein
MCYLTDVIEDDQNFAFYPKSHHGLKSHRAVKSRFKDDWVDQNIPEVMEVTAPAETAVIFDTTAIHRLRRKNTRQRDSITFYYHAGHLQKGQQKISRAIYDTLGEHVRSQLIPVD